MPLSTSEREKLLNTLQKTFPLASQWAEIKKDRKFYCKTKEEWLGLLVVIVLSGSLCIGLLYLTNKMVSTATVVALLLAFVCVTGGVLSGAASLLLSGFNVQSLHHTYKMKKMRKRGQQYKEKMRDYVCEKTCVRYVQATLPNLSDSDLKLLSMHPDLNPVFKKYFKEETSRREKQEAVSKIKTEFLSPVIAVESSLLKDDKQNAYNINNVKINI